MAYQFTVSPDFGARHAPAWYMFNTWLQRALGEPIHLEIYDGFEAQRRAVADDRIDLIYANPYDASALIRERGFAALAAPAGRSDETLVVVPAGSAVERVEGLPRRLRIAATDDPDVYLMGMILLEPAALPLDEIAIVRRNSYVLVAKELLQGAADLGFFLEATFDELSQVVRSGLRTIAKSRIHVIRHALLVGPRLAPRAPELASALIAMTETPRERELLASLGIPVWEAMGQEDVEFMIDLIDALAERPA